MSGDYTEGHLVRMHVEPLRLALSSPVTADSLRAAMERLSFIPPPAAFPRSVLDEVADVLRAAGIAHAGAPATVVLREDAGERSISIEIGAAELNALAQVLHGLPLARPQTHDLTMGLLGAGGVQVESVAITRRVDDIYHAAIRVVPPGGSAAVVDARPSDAVNLALRARVPIYVAEELLTQGS